MNKALMPQSQATVQGQVAALSDEALRVKVAQLCEFTDIEYEGHWMGFVKGQFGTRQEIPNYPADLNAMYEAEHKMHNFLGYFENLALVMRLPIASIALIHATARQRAEAFVLTLRLKSITPTNRA